MPYIGKEPVAGNFVLLDSITTSATATYALTKDSVAYSPESARNMIVSLNGVTQAPEAAFTLPLERYHGNRGCTIHTFGNFNG